MKETLKKILAKTDLFVYENSLDEAEGTACAMVKNSNEKLLAVAGPKADLFKGSLENGFLLCPLTNENAEALQTLFPYTRPKSHKGHAFTMGLGDRLGLATPGHIRALRGHDIYPVFAQQSIRELNLTHRTFRDVISAASFNVFQEGYKSGFGADGDHLKTKDEIKYALESGCTMVTLDCSEKINTKDAKFTDDEVNAAYSELPRDVREHYENTYLGKDLPILGRVDEPELRRFVIVFWKAVDHAIKCYKYIDEIKTVDVDFELSIDETLTITTPAEHFIIGNELHNAGITPISCAPHFTGQFEKGIEYAGNLTAFERDFRVHQEIAEHFGYKLSLHSGSDKFAVFSTVARVTKGNVHVKTAGTNWLEAMRVVSEVDPSLYRKAHKYAIEHRPEAEKYYHVSTNVSEIPDIDLQNDAYLPEYLNLPASRQTIHIAYGLLLENEWFRKEFFRCMFENEDLYYAFLERHIGKHIRMLTSD